LHFFTHFRAIEEQMIDVKSLGEDHGENQNQNIKWQKTKTIKNRTFKLKLTSVCNCVTALQL